VGGGDAEMGDNMTLTTFCLVLHGLHTSLMELSIASVFTVGVADDILMHLHAAFLSAETAFFRLTGRRWREINRLDLDHTSPAPWVQAAHRATTAPREA
jgi:hypothetical protein